MKNKNKTVTLIDKSKKYTFNAALDILKKNSKKKFEESIEVSMQFNIIPKKNIIIKGYSSLKNNIGKNNKIAIFSNNIDEYINFNNVVILNDEILKNLSKKNINFDIILTTPDNVVKFTKLGKLINGKKIMPDVKYGTVTTDILGSLTKLANNYIKYKIDKNYCINLLLGKISLTNNELKENIEQLILDIKKQKPQNCKSISLKNIYISSTMGCGIKVDLDSINC